MMRLARLVSLLMVALVLLPHPADAASRAFVAGINAYDQKEWGNLETAVNDANALEAVLRGAGFSIVRVTDASRATFDKR
jgi:uncharacterized caspase-like protein